MSGKPRKGPKSRLKVKLPTLSPSAPSEAPVPEGLKDRDVLHFIDGTKAEVHADELTQVGDILGRGAYGYVTVNLYKPTNLRFAIKHIRLQDDPNERKAMLKDLEVNRQARECPYTVTFMGALCREGEVLICMELMETSLHQYYTDAHKYQLGMPEPVLGAITFAVLSALKYLKDKLSVIHRDVKPSNILLNKNSDSKIEIKLCDFGIAGNLINSMAKTNVGCKPYMAPERIEQRVGQEYGANSDIWSLGISLVEMANGRHPYSDTVGNAFHLLKQIMTEPPPTLEQDERFSPHLVDFVNQSLTKEPENRATFNDLLGHNFVGNFSDNIAQQPEAVIQHYYAVKSHQASESA